MFFLPSPCKQANVLELYSSNKVPLLVLFFNLFLIKACFFSACHVNPMPTCAPSPNLLLTQGLCHVHLRSILAYDRSELGLPLSICLRAKKALIHLSVTLSRLQLQAISLMKQHVYLLKSPLFICSLTFFFLDITVSLLIWDTYLACPSVLQDN